MRTYKFEVSGTCSGGETYLCQGELECPIGGVFQDMLLKCMAESFKQLTGGKAVFGKPGVGCRGPYNITRVLVEQKPE